MIEMGGIMDALARDSFQAFVAHGTNLVFVWANWAPPARRMRATVESLATRLPEGVRIGIVDSDADVDFTRELTTNLPALFVYRDGARVLALTGDVALDRLIAALGGAGVGVSPAAPAGDATAWSVTDALKDFNQKMAMLAHADREPLATTLRQYAAVMQVPGADVDAHIDAALEALKMLPGLFMGLLKGAQDAGRPAWQRLGALSGLLYGAAPTDALRDDLPGGYGFLDDWVVINAAWWVYIAPPPSPEQMTALTQLASFVWMSLPAPIIAPLAQFVARMDQEKAWLMQQPEAQMEALRQQVLAQPAPMVMVLPPVAPQTGAAAASSRPGLEGWSVNDAGAIWGNGRSTYLSFDSGGGVGMVGDKIVGAGI
jgi:uncharacterized membrane protein YkvA (DUF1232 family)